ncbi:MAG TPA: hypothetical protein VMO47_09020, partial [Rhodothermales bacterium]|nr:hypothetical protein [Rhodothermales bacterium]
VRLASLGLEDELAHAASLANVVIGEEAPPTRSGARMIPGEPPDMVSQLVVALESEARVI